ncbi:unnamed protein product [Camellia sinensis]
MLFPTSVSHLLYVAITLLVSHFRNSFFPNLNPNLLDALLPATSSLVLIWGGGDGLAAVVAAIGERWRQLRYTTVGTEILPKIKTRDVIRSTKLMEVQDRLVLPDEN